MERKVSRSASREQSHQTGEGRLSKGFKEEVALEWALRLDGSNDGSCCLHIHSNSSVPLT